MSPEISTLTTRRHKLFPVLEEREVQRLTRYGEMRTFAPGENLATAGRHSAGVMVILSGNVRVTRKDVVGVEEHIVTHGPRSLLGGLEQLAGRPSLVDARAVGAVTGTAARVECGRAGHRRLR